MLQVHDHVEVGVGRAEGGEEGLSTTRKRNGTWSGPLHLPPLYVGLGLQLHSISCVETVRIPDDLLAQWGRYVLAKGQAHFIISNSQLVCMECVLRDKCFIYHS